VSAREQELLIATVNYHVGHTISIRVAEQEGYFREEGLERYAYESAGLVPAPFERDALGLAMVEHGVDIAAAVKVSAVLYQRSLGADLYIVGGWRIDGPAGTKWYGRPDLRRPADVAGRRVGIRERGSMDEVFLCSALRVAGVAGEPDVTWICDPMFYANDAREFEALAEDRVDLIPVQPAYWAEAERRGFSLVVDTTTLFPAGRPGKVIVATARTIDERRPELEAFLRANIRAFWYCRNAANYEALSALDRHWRTFSHNEFEHQTTLVASAEMMSGWSMPLDGGLSRDQLGSIIDDLTARNLLAAPLTIDDVLRDEPRQAAYANLAARPEFAADLERNRTLVDRFRY
jgi:ABC-type nitrate/sulfonate/bicarbonate transport system substrate-binding protein